MLFLIIYNVKKLKVKDFAECLSTDFGVLSPKCVYALNTHQTTEGSRTPGSSFTKTKAQWSDDAASVDYVKAPENNERHVIRQQGAPSLPASEGTKGLGF